MTANEETKNSEQSKVDPLIGTTFDGQFNILERLGVGGNSVVYLADQVSVGRQVAIKVITPIGANQTADARFKREVQLLSGLKHKNIVEIFRGGVFNQRPYLVMEYLPGKTLSAYLADGKPMSVEKTLKITSQCCDALEEAHKKGIIHRDLKPGNIFITEINGEPLVKIIDFGLSKLFVGDGKDQKLTSTGVLSGTPAYMSPEQCRGEELDPRTDLYSLGCVVYQMLTGKTPFEGDSAYALMSKHDADTPPPLNLSQTVPPYLETAVFKLLEKARKNRFESAAELKEYLQSASGNRRFWQRKRNRWQVGAAAAVLSLVTIAIGFFFSAKVNEEPQDVLVYRTFQDLLQTKRTNIETFRSVENELIDALERKGDYGGAADVARSAAEYANDEDGFPCTLESAQVTELAAKKMSSGDKSRFDKAMITHYWHKAGDAYVYAARQRMHIEQGGAVLELWDKAIENLAQACSCRTDPYLAELYMAQTELINIYCNNGELDKAEAHLRTLADYLAHDERMERTTKTKRALLLASQALVYKAKGQYKQALETLDQCLKLVPPNGMSYNMILITKGLTFEQEKNFAQANATFLQAVQNSEAIENEKYVGEERYPPTSASKMIYANFLLNNGKKREASYYFARAYERITAMDHPLQTYWTMFRAARGLRLCGNSDASAAILKQAKGQMLFKMKTTRTPSMKAIQTRLLKLGELELAAAERGDIHSDVTPELKSNYLFLHAPRALEHAE